VKPRLLYSRLGRRIYVVTRYTIQGRILIAHRKYDVTEDFKTLRRQRVRLAEAPSGATGRREATT